MALGVEVRSSGMRRSFANRAACTLTRWSSISCPDLVNVTASIAFRTVCATLVGPAPTRISAFCIRARISDVSISLRGLRRWSPRYPAISAALVGVWPSARACAYSSLWISLRVGSPNGGRDGFGIRGGLIIEQGDIWVCGCRISCRNGCRSLASVCRPNSRSHKRYSRRCGLEDGLGIGDWQGLYRTDPGACR